MHHIFSGNTVLDLDDDDDDDDGDDSAHPLPIIIDRKRVPSGSKIPNPHRNRAAVSTRTTKSKNEAKPLTISTMFVWECTKTALGRKDPGTSNNLLTGRNNQF